MPSKQANQVLADMLERHPDGVGFDEAVSEVQTRCEVAPNTAEAYVRRSDQTNVETNLDGDKMVVPPGDGGETVVHDEKEVLEMEVGDPSGDSFGQLDVLEDVGHPEVPVGHADGYIRRRMGDSGSSLGRKTDVQVVTSAMADPDFSTMLIGKHGVGKDRLILHICAKTNRPVVRLVANDDPDFVDLLVGTYSPDGDGNFVHKKGLLSVAIENGYTFILDEFNALSGKVQTMLNMILEDADQNQLVIPETNEMIEPHPQFTFVATQNPNEIGYGGREDVDQATGSRFIPIELPPLNETGEKKVVAHETHWAEDSPELNKILTSNGGIVTGLRQMHQAGKMSTWISTRDVIQIGRMTERLGDVKAATELILLGRAEPEDEDPIRSKIQDTRW